MSIRWDDLGWALIHQPYEPDWEPKLSDQYLEIVLRGAARLNPALTRILHEGGK